MFIFPGRVTSDFVGPYFLMYRLPLDNVLYTESDRVTDVYKRARDDTYIPYEKIRRKYRIHFVHVTHRFRGNQVWKFIRYTWTVVNPEPNKNK